MMQEAFLRAIRESPKDDAVRLVFADWLEERAEGDDLARAEFIRKQCKHEWWASHAGENVFYPTTGETITGGQAGGYLAETQNLLARHEQAWLQDFPLLVPGAGFVVVWKRGFVAEIGCHASLWQDHGPLVVTSTPLDRVWITGKVPQAYYLRLYHWFFEERDGVHETSLLPLEWLPYFARRKLRNRKGNGFLRFTTMKGAKDALDAAALAWAGDVASAEEMTR